MSNAMSRSKSRWKGALLAAVATTAVLPLASKAQSLTLSLSLSPLDAIGTTVNHVPQVASNAYVAPDALVPIYVYATVTGNALDGAISPSNVAGLEYAYFNVSTVSGGSGQVVSATPNSALGFIANGSQAGVTNFSSGTLAVGDATNISNMAKPRAAGPVWSSAVTSDGANVVVDGNSISYLIETLEYQPNFTAAPVGTALNQTSLTVSVPSTATLGSSYPQSNYFANLQTTPAFSSNQSAGYSNTSTAAIAGVTSLAAEAGLSGAISITPTVTLTEAEQGDVNLDGQVNGVDSGIIASNFNKPEIGWINGDISGAGGAQDNFVNGADSGVVASNFNKVYGTAPSDLTAGATAQIGGATGTAVPEPTSLALLAMGSLALLGRRRSRV